MTRKLSSRPINTAWGGVCQTIKAGYYKMGWTNFTRAILGYSDGFSATAVAEVYEDDCCVRQQEPGEELREGRME